MAIDKAKEVREGEELNWRSLESYLKSEVNGLNGEMEVKQFHGGHANLTYLLLFGDQQFILRRPPFGKIAPGAHDMKREFRVLSKLYTQFSRAPRAYLYCEDSEIIGSPFVMAERRSGVIVRYKVPEVFAAIENVEQRLTDALIKALADLHTVDVVKADLIKLGRPDGFIQRQLDGWAKRWSLVKIDQQSNIMERVHAALIKDIPKPQAASIIHNDIKFDNCQFQANSPDEVTSIFDWDMTTLGDPLADLGMSLSYWPDPKMADYKELPVMLKGDFPDKEYFINKYAEHTGYDVSQAYWYEALSYWKGAVIAQQLYKRYCDGDTKDERMASFGMSAQALGELALEKILR